ncbi:MAG: hypothetical protein MUD15_10550 [Desulfobacterota bacterium]|jgi:hypothetical protein|nr:hypothetical protein [Thermodesulfobacteriota bacterium]
MNNGKQRIMKSFRMEMVGAGLYRSLSSQYRNSEPKLSERFSAFAGHEYRHGRMFEKHFLKTYGETLRGGRFWMFLGRVMAFLARPLSLRKKMKRLSIIESQAVADIETSLNGSGDTGMNRILSIILPDEKAHAGLYHEVFHGHEQQTACEEGIR